MNIDDFANSNSSSSATQVIANATASPHPTTSHQSSNQRAKARFAAPLKIRIGILASGLILSGTMVGGSTALLLKQRDLGQALSDKSVATLENEIKRLEQEITRAKDRQSQTFAETGFSDVYFEKANETSNLELEKSAYAETLADKTNPEAEEEAEEDAEIDVTTLSKEDSVLSEISPELEARIESLNASNAELVAAMNTNAANRLSLPINLLFLFAAVPSAFGIILFFKL